MNGAQQTFWHNPLTLIGCLIVIFLFTGCGAANDAIVPDDASALVLAPAPVGKHLPDIAPAQPAVALIGQYLSANDEQLAALRDAEIADADVPLCDHAARPVDITRGGAQFVITNAVQYNGLPNSVPLLITESGVMLITQDAGRGIACSGALQQELLVLTCDVTVLDHAETCQIVLHHQ